MTSATATTTASATCVTASASETTTSISASGVERTVIAVRGAVRIVIVSRIRCRLLGVHITAIHIICGTPVSSCSIFNGIHPIVATTVVYNSGAGLAMTRRICSVIFPSTVVIDNSCPSGPAHRHTGTS